MLAAFALCRDASSTRCLVSSPPLVLKAFCHAAAPILPSASQHLVCLWEVTVLLCSVSAPFGDSSPGPFLTRPHLLLPKCGARDGALHLQAPECLSWSTSESSLLHRGVLPSLTCSPSIRSPGHDLSTTIGCHSLGPSTGSVHGLPFRLPAPESRPGSLSSLLSPPSQSVTCP